MTLATAEAALLGLLRRPPGGEALAIAAGEWTRIAAIAAGHGLQPLLHRALLARPGLEAPAALLEAFERERRRTALANLRNYGQFRAIARAFAERGIALMALKGLHLAELVYRDVSLRPMADMDILVPRTALGRAVEVLGQLEYGHAADLSAEAEAIAAEKVNIGLAHRRLEVWVEVHWALDDPQGRESDYMRDVWEAALPGRLGDADVRIMSPGFLLQHVCAHLACNHAFAFSLRALCDVAEILERHRDLDWDAIAERAGRHRCARGVAAALRLAVEHLGAQAPPEALRLLGADRLPAEVLAEAMRHVLSSTTLPESLRTAPNVLAAAGTASPALVWKRVFVEREELAWLYGVPRDSPRLPFYYVARLAHLVRRYGRSLWALKVTDRVLAESAARHLRLARWVREEA